jgi:hypothetical protein
LVVFISMNTIDSRTGDFHPISPRPCRAYTIRWSRRRRRRCSSERYLLYDYSISNSFKGGLP